jgi:hypothetical protein
MLTKEALQLFSRKHERGDADIYILRALLAKELAVSQREFFVGEQARVVREVKRAMLSDLWQSLYGDITKQIPPLHNTCLVHMDRMQMWGSENPIEQGFQTLLKTLKPPLEWMDDLVVVRPKERDVALAK